MVSCHSLTRASTENQSRIRSAKPEWDKLQARFIKSFNMEKEEEDSITTPTRIASSLSFPAFGYSKVTKEGDKIYSFGSDITGSPDIFVCRQRYLRSYVFTREEENNKSNNDNTKGGLEKIKRWFEVKKKGKGKAKGKPEITNPCSCSDTCLKFLLRYIPKADVQTEGPVA
ncbi:unnamed protein product [Dovyalis caffra]|uniref:Uncharacterized protein n=1 Tax=Dovyalis caffra TaxID=77055 RepID=A0AAV1RVC7_9ROSI|nr:unnamed protein product [Dovyalis caffra]